jgi:hypothetical protein
MSLSTIVNRCGRSILHKGMSVKDPKVQMSQNIKSFITKLFKQTTEKTLFVLVLVTMAGPVLGQTSNPSITVGPGQLAYTMSETSGSCVAEPSHTQVTYQTYTFYGFYFTVPGSPTKSASGQTSYNAVPAAGIGDTCPTPGWQAPNPLTLTFPGYVISFTASISGASSATIQSVTLGNPTASISCSPNPITFGTSTSCTTSVSGGATGTVNWTINGSPWTSTTLSGGATSAGAGVFSSYATGSYTIGATYTGDQITIRQLPHL